jgi:hypothetical protein
MASTLLDLFVDAWRFLLLCLRLAPALAAKHLFLRTQLAQYQVSGMAHGNGFGHAYEGDIGCAASGQGSTADTCGRALA